MTKAPIPIEDSRLVTVGMFKTLVKQEGLVTVQELRKLEERMDKKFVTNEQFERTMTTVASTLNQLQESIQSLANVVAREFAALREENKEFRQRTAQLERTDLIHKRKIDELDGRVLKLETAA